MEHLQRKVAELEQRVNALEMLLHTRVANLEKQIKRISEILWKVADVD